MTPATEQDFLALFDRTFPPDYIAGLKSGDGYELLKGFAAVGARLALALSRLDLQGFIGSATGAAYATGQVQLSRPAGGALPGVTVKAGTVLTTSNGARDFTTTEDAVFAPAALGPITVAVRAIAPGYEWNVPGAAVAADGELLPGDIDTVKVLSEDPILSDTSITVSQALATSGGQPAVLDQLGQDRGIPRQPGEQDGHYRQRIRSLPDAVSPAAIKRNLAAYLAAFDTVATFLESFERSYQDAYDTTGTTFVYDDPRPVSPFRNRWLDELEQYATFFVVVENLQPVGDAGMCFDDTAPDVDALKSPAIPGGRRSVCAYDVPATTPANALQGAYDAGDAGKAAVYAGLFKLLQQIKAAGVAAILEKKGA